MSDIMLASDISKHLAPAIVSSEFCEEDLAERRQQWEEGGQKRDANVAAAYRALEEGRQMVDLHTVIERDGTGRSNMPALALARGDVKQINARLTRGGNLRYVARGATKHWTMDFSVGFRPTGTAAWYAATALAPAMPPEIRPNKPKDYLVLWEAEWRNLREARPPMAIDPALLEHVTGSLYVVVATWDLTELEAAALR